MDKELLKTKIETAFENFKAAIRQHADINKKRADGGWAVGEIANRGKRLCLFYDSILLCGIKFYHIGAIEA